MPQDCRRVFPLPALAVCLASAAGWGAEPPAPDTSAWDCRHCPFDTGFGGTVEAGAGYASSAPFRIGTYRGLDDDGRFIAAGAELGYRDPRGYYWDLAAADLGLDTREARAEFGAQGRYGLSIGYDELPTLLPDGGRTPYLGGGETLGLPAGWVRATDTGDFATLARDLHPFAIEQRRRRVDLGAHYVASRHWRYSVAYRNERKDGLKTIGAAIGGPLFFQTRSAILPEPVDYETHSVELAASYAARNTQVELGYLGSFFTDRNAALSWDNAFLGADRGRLALPPDNHFHQLHLSAGHRLSAATRLSGRLAVSRATQDDPFLPAATDSALATTLPRRSLDGRVDGVNGRLRISTGFGERWSVDGELNYEQRDNRTARSRYAYVIGDTAPAASERSNLPYGFERAALNLHAAYRVSDDNRLSLGYGYDRRDRTLQQIDTTREHTLRGEWRWRAGEPLEVTFSAARGERRGSAFELEPEVQPQQNPLLRKFNLADRERDVGGLVLAYTPTERVSIDFSADYARDRYDESVLGLTDGRDLAFTVSASATPAAGATAYAFWTRQNTRARQSGSEAFAAPDWRARLDDRSDTLGAGVDWTSASRRWRVALDYAYYRERGEIFVHSDGSATAPFPDLEARRHSLALTARYQWNKALALRIGYLVEDYDETAWPVDGVEPDTIDGVLSLGRPDQSFRAHVTTVSLEYRY